MRIFLGGEYDKKNKKYSYLSIVFVGLWPFGEESSWVLGVIDLLFFLSEEDLLFDFLSSNNTKINENYAFQQLIFSLNLNKNNVKSSWIYQPLHYLISLSLSMLPNKPDSFF